MHAVKYIAPLFAGLVLGCTASLWGRTGGARLDDPFADVVVSFQPGNNAGFGQDQYPDVVLWSSPW